MNRCLVETVGMQTRIRARAEIERGCWCLLFVIVVTVVPAAAQVDQARAEQYFKEAQALCERDGGRLWGVSLCGPMVIADAATGTMATSQPAPAGDHPRMIGFVNAPVQWGGTTWSAYNWQMIPADDRAVRGAAVHARAVSSHPARPRADGSRQRRECPSRFSGGPLLDAARVAGRWRGR
jgi:hypothetical protein